MSSLGNIITFDDDDATKKAILGAFDLEVNDNGIIVSSITKEPALTPEGLDIPLSKFAGIRPGSRKMIRSDIVSLMDAADDMMATQRP